MRACARVLWSEASLLCMAPPPPLARHLPKNHTLRVSLSFAASIPTNADAANVTFYLHEHARTIVAYLHGAWGERWIANVFHGVI